MPPDIEVLLLRLIGGDSTAPSEVLDRARTTDSPALLVAAAIVCATPAESAGLLIRAAQHAATTRHRQLVAIAGAYLKDDADLLDALARDHLSDHPDHILAAWIASRGTATDTGTGDVFVGEVRSSIETTDACVDRASHDL